MEPFLFRKILKGSLRLMLDRTKRGHKNAITIYVTSGGIVTVIWHLHLS